MPKYHCTARTLHNTRCKNFRLHQNVSNVSLCGIHLRYPPKSDSKLRFQIHIHTENEPEKNIFSAEPKKKITAEIRANPLRKEFIKLKEELANLKKEYTEYHDKNSRREWEKVIRIYENYEEVMDHFIRENILYTKDFKEEIKRRWEDYFPQNVPYEKPAALRTLVWYTFALKKENLLDNLGYFFLTLNNKSEEKRQKEVGDFLWYLFSKNPEWVQFFQQNFQKKIKQDKLEELDETYLLPKQEEEDQD